MPCHTPGLLAKGFVLGPRGLGAARRPRVAAKIIHWETLLWRRAGAPGVLPSSCAGHVRFSNHGLRALAPDSRVAVVNASESRQLERPRDVVDHGVGVSFTPRPFPAPIFYLSLCLSIRPTSLEHPRTIRLLLEHTRGAGKLWPAQLWLWV